MDCSAAEDSQFCESQGGNIFPESSCGEFFNTPDECPFQCKFCLGRFTRGDRATYTGLLCLWAWCYHLYEEAIWKFVLSHTSICVIIGNGTLVILFYNSVQDAQTMVEGSLMMKTRNKI